MRLRVSIPLVLVIAGLIFLRLGIWERDNIIAQGPTIKVTELDTLWFAPKQVGVANSFDGGPDETATWIYPLKGLMPKEGGGFLEPIVRPTRFFLYAAEPFSWKGFLAGGDSLSRSHIMTDAMIEVAPGGAGPGQRTIRYPVWTTIRGGLDSLRIMPTPGDTCFVVPLLLKP